MGWIVFVVWSHVLFGIVSAFGDQARFYTPTHLSTKHRLRCDALLYSYALDDRSEYCDAACWWWWCCWLFKYDNNRRRLSCVRTIGHRVSRRSPVDVVCRQTQTPLNCVVNCNFRIASWMRWYRSDRAQYYIDNIILNSTEPCDCAQTTRERVCYPVCCVCCVCG